MPPQQSATKPAGFVPDGFIPDEPKVSQEDIVKTAAVDMGKGAAKSLGKSGLDLTQLLTRTNPARIMALPATWPAELAGRSPFDQSPAIQKQAEDLLTPTNRAQKVGKGAMDVLSTLIPAGMAVKGLRAGGAAQVAQEALPVASSALSSPATGLTAADFLASLQGAKAAAPVVPVATAATSTLSPSISRLLGEGAIQGTKYVAGGAVANMLRHLLGGGQ